MRPAVGPIETGRFRTSAATLEYAHVSGDIRPSLCMLHGLGARWQTFRPLVRSLGPGWDVYAPDLRGHGRSDWVAGHYALADFAVDVEQFVTERIGAPVVLFGHSMGGWIAAMVAATRPDLVRAVVIVDSALYRLNDSQRAAMLGYAVPNQAMRSIAVSLRMADPELNQRWVEGRNQREQDPDELMSRLRCPVLLVQGDERTGALMTDEHVRRALGLLADGAHVFVPGTGHAVHAEAPGPVADALRAFLAEQIDKSEPNGEFR